MVHVYVFLSDAYPKSDVRSTEVLHFGPSRITRGRIDIGQNLQTEIRYGIMIISPTKQVHGQKWPNHSTTREMLSVWRYGIKPA